jgi:feruloyl-CoA synthase
VPTPGLELKLVDTDGKVEVRYRGPTLTLAGLAARQEQLEAFDEGFEDRAMRSSGSSAQGLRYIY